MAEPFKNRLNREVVASMATHFKKNWSDFDEQAFINDVLKTLESLELKARTHLITKMMIRYLPADFEHSGNVLLASLGKPLGDELSTTTFDNEGISGWVITSLTYYVALQGHAHFDFSMRLLKEMTRRFSSEFDIRAFLISEPKRTEATLKLWAEDECQHVRRLASEGCRSRLPWAMQLPQYINDPRPIIDILEILKDDEKEYVRRSVANNLNDIAKDHPELIVTLVERWLENASGQRRKLLKHACRSLIKQGHKRVLELFGFKSVIIKSVDLNLSTAVLPFGESLMIELSIVSGVKCSQPIIIDYIIHHQKANGARTPKVFKWKTTELIGNENLHLTKKHTIKKISTRKYYPGLHTVEVIVNGESVSKVDFHLLMDDE